MVASRGKLVDSRINQGCFARRKFFRARQDTLPGEPNLTLMAGKFLLREANVLTRESKLLPRESTMVTS
jgi:hypothetical protein